jgi:ectoine hydroxylase-related dioxygenase (phytanoyl-CoA dioxygenase family)
MLSESELARYREHGFIVPDFRLPQETIEAIRRDHARLIERRPEFVDYCPTVLAYDLSFLNYARIPELVDMVEQILGPNFALWNSSFFAKPAFKGRKTPWHQDGEYWPIRPIATCTVWIAVDASTPENGCLRVIRGSHNAKRLFRHSTNPDRNLTLNQELEPSEYDERDAVDIVLKAGQVSLHDVFLVHGSEKNTSANPRRGMTLRFMPTSSVFDRELARRQREEKQLPTGHEQRTLFLMRGRDLSGKNDFTLRL